MRLLRASVVAVFVLAGLLALTGAANADGRHYEDIVDITFPAPAEMAQSPTSGGMGFIDDYFFSRGNTCGIHRATDLMGPHGAKVYAARSGTVTLTRTGSHNWLRLEDADGYRHTYLHLGRNYGPRDEAFAPGIEEGVHVERGEHIGFVGSSGNASESAPHLHFEINHTDLHDTPCRASGWGYYNPYASLIDAIARGDVPGMDDGESSDDGEPTDESQPDGAGAEIDHVDRIAGSTRISTAADLATAAFPDGADHVVIGPAYSFQETIAAGPLAAALGGPVVTTEPEELHERAAEAIRELAPERVTLVGDHDVLGYGVFDDLVANTDVHGEHIERLAGEGPAATAATVADRVLSHTETDTVLVARGADPEADDAWPDALTGGWYGAVTGAPVLLTTPDGLPESTAGALADADAATIVGGTAAISEDVEAALGEHVDTVDRLAGSTRFTTATALVDALLADGAIDPDRLWAATGGDFADALAAAPAVAAQGGALTLIDGTEGDADDGLDDWFAEHHDRFETGAAIGGTEAISDDALRIFGERLE